MKSKRTIAKSAKSLAPSLASSPRKSMYSKDSSRKSSLSSFQGLLSPRNPMNIQSAIQKLKRSKTFCRQSSKHHKSKDKQIKLLKAMLETKQKEAKIYAEELNQYRTLYKTLFESISNNEGGLRILDIANQLRNEVKEKKFKTAKSKKVILNIENPHDDKFRNQFADLISRTDLLLKKLVKNIKNKNS